MTPILLPLDTETTGLYKKSLPFNDPSQPHLVSCAALQVRADNYHIQQSMNKVVFPQHWDWDDSAESQDKAFEKHKLTVDYCLEFGRDEKDVLDEILHLWESANCTLVAHNLNFDRNVIACAIARHYPKDTELLKSWLEAPGFCTMDAAKPIVEAQTKPNAQGKTRLKPPSLAEAYEFFTGEELDETGHHSANRDAVACLQIYAGILEHKNAH